MKKFNEHGMRMTDCCGCMSTFCMDSGALVCKDCYNEVSTGEGDGCETSTQALPSIRHSFSLVSSRKKVVKKKSSR